MPRYFHNLSSVYSFMKAALRNDTVAIHLPAMKNPMYKLDDVKNAPSNVLALVLTEVNTGKRLLQFHLKEDADKQTLEMYNCFIRDKTFTPYKGSKLLPLILFNFLDCYAEACGHKSISVVLSKNGYHDYNLKKEGYELAWGYRNCCRVVKRIQKITFP